MLNSFSIFLGKLVINLSQLFNLGSGSTWPGHIALKANRNFIKDILGNSNTKIIVVAGTNGKTTTGRLITSIIRENNKTYLQNKEGANLINGLASTLIKGLTFSGKLKQDYLIFEADENALPDVIEQANPHYIVCLDLFRDQLDRYGEIDSIAKKWHATFEKLTPKTTLILNANDPQIAYLSQNSDAKALFFGINDKGKEKTEHGADSLYCPNCSSKFIYQKVFFSHLGEWKCSKCELEMPKSDIQQLKIYPLSGTYNKYNALAAALFAKAEKIPQDKVEKSYTNFTPAFGRQEKLTYLNKNVQIFLSKNPTSFNESLETIKSLGGKNILIILNNKIPDGLDISWIWDINFENIITPEFNIAVSGDRTEDMALRLKYSNLFAHSDNDTKNIFDRMINELENDETLYILPNYSSMLDIRKIITGKKLL